MWHFGEFRACCRFSEEAKPDVFLTHSEAWKVAIRIALEKHGRYREHEARDVYRNSVIVTRLELFEIPPRKIGANLKELIINVLS